MKAKCILILICALAGSAYSFAQPSSTVGLGIGSGNGGTIVEGSREFSLEGSTYISAHGAFYPRLSGDALGNLGGYFNFGITPNITSSNNRLSRMVYGWTSFSLGLGYEVPVAGFTLRPFGGIGYAMGQAQFSDSLTNRQYQSEVFNSYFNLNFGATLGVSRGYGVYFSYDTAPRAASIGISFTPF